MVSLEQAEFLPKMSNLDYITNYNFPHVICN